ncbi:MAG: glycosyltransferase family 39 protein [Methanobacterium sp.]|nr:glycosyltransferase family 39 protein [Methanobacterium sp.]
MIILVIIISIITYFRMKIQMNIGPIWDTYDFLSNALVFAGQPIGYSDLTRPPLISFLTSVLFRLGYVSVSTIFFVDGALFIFGVVGLFLLLNLRFNYMESFLGSLIYGTFPIVISFVGFGLSDIASVSFTIWAFYFMALAVKKNSKYFYLSFPFMMLAFLTRYPSALLIFPAALYIFINIRTVEKRDAIIGIGVSLLLLIPVFIFFYKVFGNPLYSFLSFFGLTSTTISAENFSYDPNLLYFVEKTPAYIGAQSIAIISIIMLGTILYTINRLKGDSKLKINIFNAINIKNKNTRIKLLILMIMTLIFLGTFGKAFYMVSESLFFAICYIFYSLIKNLNIKDIDLHLLFFAWFMAFFIFHSIFVIKDNRYFVTMAPAVSYFLIWGLSEIYAKIGFKIRNINVTSYVLSLILIFMILSATASYLPGIQNKNYKLKIMDENIDLSSQWLMNYDPNYKNKAVYSNAWPYFGWYLKTDVKMMPLFKDNQTYYGGLKNYNFSQQDIISFNNYLESNNAYYYLSYGISLNLTSYQQIKKFGNVIIYEKKSKS